MAAAADDDDGSTPARRANQRAYREQSNKRMKWKE